MLSYTEARRAEKDLDAVPGQPPGWLGVLEVATRAWLATRTGEEIKARDLYASLVTRTADGSANHAAAVAGVAVATARMALAGLADRHEAERLLRQSIEAQKRLGMVGYNSHEVGTAMAERFLTLLLGPTPEALAFIADQGDNVVSIEIGLQGNSENRAHALRAVRAAAETADPLNADQWDFAFSLAHAELAVGSAAEGVRWGDLVIERLERRRLQESDDEIRMKGDSSYASYYHLYVSDLLDRSASDPAHLKRAWRVSEQLRARIPLETLLARAEGCVAPSDAIPELEAVRAALRSDEALVSFMIWAPRPSESMPYLRGHSYALVLTKTGLRAVRVATGEVLEPAVRAWKGLARSRPKACPRVLVGFTKRYCGLCWRCFRGRSVLSSSSPTDRFTLLHSMLCPRRVDAPIWPSGTLSQSCHRRPCGSASGIVRTSKPVWRSRSPTRRMGQPSPWRRLGAKLLQASSAHSCTLGRRRSRPSMPFPTEVGSWPEPMRRRGISRPTS